MEDFVKGCPRPQLVREGWVCLDGEWDFLFDDGDVGVERRFFERFPKEGRLRIRVPFSYETALSGIGVKEAHGVVWYRREVCVEKREGERVLLHFEGCDFETFVWVNGRFAGRHRGGYVRFSFDVTDVVENGVNEVVVRVWDSRDKRQLRGKQRWKDRSFDCWYVQTTGIWKPVWLERVPEVFVKGLKLSPRLGERCVDVSAEIEGCVNGVWLETEVWFEGKQVSEVRVPVTRGCVSVSVNVYNPEICNHSVMEWSPERPSLYDMLVRLTRNGVCVDSVRSYFGMRDVRVSGSQVLLNGSPLYQRLVLNQGYWKESGLTPPDEEAMIRDIDRIAALGFNGMRIHQKVEDERFLYWCDVKGMLVWCEAPSAYEFDDVMMEGFLDEWGRIVRQFYSHPSIITWTPVNESWGVPAVKSDVRQQAFVQAIYYMTKALDPMRPVIVNDGWEHTISDIVTLHDYQERADLFAEKYSDPERILGNREAFNGSRYAFADGFSYRGQPVIISEYGGIAFQNEEEGWGYGNKVRDEKGFLKRFGEITEAIQRLPYVCGYCYTQATDVQQEINGVMNMDREYKVDPEAFRALNTRSFGY